MKKLFEIADRYVAESNWRVLALLKFCLFAMGLMAGLCAPQKARKPLMAGAATVFLATYVPLMAKFFRVAGKTLRGE